MNYILKRNNVLCLGVIPKGTKSEKNYKITFRAAAVLMASYKHCSKEGCECCDRVMQLISNQEVQLYLHISQFLAGKLHAETAMCDKSLLTSRAGATFRKRARNHL